MQDIAEWIGEVRESAGHTADRVTMEAKARSNAIGSERDSLEQIGSVLMESLATRAQRLRDDADELARLLERASAQIQEAMGEDGEPVQESLDVGEAAAGEESEHHADGDGISEGARLLTMQMAMAGSSRDEIKARLRDEFKVQNADGVLDEVLQKS